MTRHVPAAIVSLCGLLLFQAGVFGDDKKGDAGKGETPAPAVWKVLPTGELPKDARLGKLRDLRDAYHPWVPPTTMEGWEKARQQIRERVLVSNGLWPMPPQPTLEPVIHGTIDRGDYTIKKVYFASHPGHYVTGNLYRPKKIAGKIPGVLCPHGHWPNGRFYDSGDKGTAAQLEQSAESFLSGAHYPLQARMVQLVRMGCVVFFYDMVGYADSQQVAHRAGFTDADAALRLQNFMGLQTYNSIRALDFLLSLPEVDGSRIGVTGASGGGTQTFMLCAIDPRPTVAFPAVMVSTGMQGGCICENAEYLRIGINNIALAACFAPKPQAMSGADDWTIEIETKGLPELKQIYSLYGKANLVHAKCYPQFKHNYNEVSRELMFDWFNTHLGLKLEVPVKQQDFWPVPPAELAVFDDAHPRPADAKTSEQLREYLTEVSEAQYKALLPKNAEGVETYRQVVGTAARVMLDAGVPAPEEIETTEESLPLGDSLKLLKGTVGRKETGEQVPYAALSPKDFNGTTVLWFDGQGKSHLFGDDGRPAAAVQQLLNAGIAVASVDLFLTGEFVKPGEEPAYPQVNENYQGYTFGYNRPVLSNRVRDILTAIGAAAAHDDVRTIHLVGTGSAGPWVLLARALAGDAVDRTIVDTGDFSFGSLTSTADPMFLPGAVRYGDIGGLAALAAPGSLKLFTADSNIAGLEALVAVYAKTDGELALNSGELTSERAAEELLRPAADRR